MPKPYKIQWISLVALLSWFEGTEAQQAGYRIADSQIIVNSPRHWKNWIFAPGTVEISPTGEVRPNKLRKNTNATTQIVKFLRFHPPDDLANKEPEELSLLDAIEAGSNLADVVNVLDGDPATYWEPEALQGTADVRGQWWFGLDLGRLVFAHKIVLRFVEEGQGDPFLLFDVLVSEGLKPSRLQGGDALAFKTVLRMVQPNKSQRVFAIDLRNANREVQGEPLRFVQVVVTGTDSTQGREVSLAEYGQLAGADRGAVRFFKRQPDGREAAVTGVVHQQLDEERQGAVRYFRRERPRLAELEVWHEGDEIVSGIVARGGSMALSAKEVVNLGAFIDGNVDSNSGVLISGAQAVSDPERFLFFDLGSFYWIDAHRQAYGRGSYRGSFANYRLDFSDGSLAPDGSLWWTRAVERDQPRVAGRPYEGNRFDPVKARFFRIHWSMQVRGLIVATLAEVQLYGNGFQPEVSLESDLIQLGGTRNLISVEWDADIPVGTQVLVQTRTGNQLGERLHYFKKDGTEVTETEYGKLLSLFKGDTVAEPVPGSDWSDWSYPYENSAGSPITSPSPREFLKIRATLTSDDPQISGALRSIRLHFADPVAQDLVGEVAPVAVDSLGVERPFSLYIRPQFVATDPGFDGLLMVVPADMRLEFKRLYAGKATDFAEPTADLSALVQDQVEVLATAGDTLRLAFPMIGPATGVEVLRLDFDTALFSAGTILRAALSNSASDEQAWQWLSPGNALDQVESNTTTLVGAVKRKELIGQLSLHPSVLTPNGDAINDRVEIAFSVVLVGDDSPVRVQIRDLRGRRVWRAVEHKAVARGHYTMSWDGRDQAGNLVPPGLYVVEIDVAAETEQTGIARGNVLRAVAVAY